MRNSVYVLIEMKSKIRSQRKRGALEKFSRALESLYPNEQGARSPLAVRRLRGDVSPSIQLYARKHGLMELEKAWNQFGGLVRRISANEFLQRIDSGASN